MTSERGEFSLIGLLVAASLFLVVLGATLLVFNEAEVQSRDHQSRLDAEDRVRVAADRMARELRNLATPTRLQPDAIYRATAYDIIFETVSPTGTPSSANPTNVEFVRYCLDDGGRLWRMEFPPGALATSTTHTPPSTTGCSPTGGWLNARFAADHITNQSITPAVDVFTFDNGGTPLNNIRRVSAQFFVDLDSHDRTGAQRITTGVNLRNQDRAPRFTGAFTYAAPEPGLVVLNASAAVDDDNDPLTYCWFDKAVPPTTVVGNCAGNASYGGAIADVPVYRYHTVGATHIVTLAVTDPSDLPATQTRNDVIVP